MSSAGRWYWFDGRIPRSTFWFCLLSITIPTVALIVLVAFGVPFTMLLIGIVELGFVAGMDGQNRYGDDPRRQDSLIAHHMRPD